jgi:hypothetical protein
VSYDRKADQSREYKLTEDSSSIKWQSVQPYYLHLCMELALGLAIRIGLNVWDALKGKNRGCSRLGFPTSYW